MLRPPSTVVGVLNVQAHGPLHFDPEAVARLEEVASVVAGLVEGAVLHDRLRRREADLEALAVRTIELQELDRRRIAGDIHDGISQRLVSAWYHLRAALSLTDDPAVTQELTTTDALLSEALEDSRRAITGLRPTLLDDLGLSAAITSVAASIGEVEVAVDLAESNLAPHVETALFRVAEETLQNVVKHAEATRVDVALVREAATASSPSPTTVSASTLRRSEGPPASAWPACRSGPACSGPPSSCARPRDTAPRSRCASPPTGPTPRRSRGPLPPCP